MNNPVMVRVKEGIEEGKPPGNDGLCHPNHHFKKTKSAFCGFAQKFFISFFLSLMVFSQKEKSASERERGRGRERERERKRERRED